jgi:hypothetical protein
MNKKNIAKLFITIFCTITPAFPDNKSAVPASVASDPAEPFLEMGKKLIIEEKFSESKEALKTAIRIAPMNLSLWALYDEAVTGEYIARMRKEKLNPVIERDINPVFAITRVDSYIELDTLYIVGTIQNVSREARQKIVLTARMLDENKKELRFETGVLRNTERGLSPNESSIFEIPVKNPPAGSKTFRVEVSAYE